MFKLARFLKQYRKQVILGPAFKLVEAIFELVVPLVMAQIIDVGIANGDTGYIFRMGGLMAVSYTHLDVYKRQRLTSSGKDPTDIMKYLLLCRRFRFTTTFLST